MSVMPGSEGIVSARVRLEHAFGMGAGTEAAVGHEAIDFDTMGSSDGPRVEEKDQAGSIFFIGQDFRIADAGGRRLTSADIRSAPPVASRR
jgi:hypothetical protein